MNISNGHSKDPFILHCNCVALPHCILLRRNCDVTALRCRMKVKFILTWNGVKLGWLAAESNRYIGTATQLWCSTQPDSHYIRYTAASVLKSTTLSTLKDIGWGVQGKWGTTRSPSLPDATVNTPQWPWMCPPGRQWQGTFDCPLAWCTSVALGCRVPTVGCHSTTVAHYSTTPQPMCSY